MLLNKRPPLAELRAAELFDARCLARMKHPTSHEPLWHQAEPRLHGIHRSHARNGRSPGLVSADRGVHATRPQPSNSLTITGVCASRGTRPVEGGKLTMSKLIVYVLYLFVTVVCVAISIWSSFQGFRSLFTYLAAPVALVIGALLFASDVFIQQERQSGRPLLPGLVLLVVAMLGSSVSNFNFFYTNALKGRVAAERLEDAYDAFDVITRVAESALEGTATRERLQALDNDVDAAMSRLRNQVRDPLNPGLGPIARGYVGEVYELLPNITELRLPGDAQDMEQVDLYIENLQRVVDEELEGIGSREKIEPALDLVAETQDRGREIFFSTRTLSNLEVERKIDAIAALERLARDLEGAVNQALVDAGAAPMPEVSPVAPQAARLGDIVYSLTSAFLERPSPGTTVFAFLASIGIDIAPLLFALLLFRKRKEQIGFAEL